MTDVAYVALGSNLGDRARYLADARSALAQLPTSRLLAESRIEETDPLGGAQQPRYLNQMVKLETALSPRELLARLHDIELRLGRTRGERWASRTIDLDLVRYDDVASDDPALRLPHPGLATRDFWQRELEELDAEAGR
ncbi:MAG TPA: 2-amino-4-hydroxy-6-hydroxymethyldihydropteridine diphosphokinase [Gemmatimonadaceae bacterium]|jgi:2-amino-4-hydroxy-6-hydroxymethyldihydropteridine diphosphokinase|nr:2-amino-4-hydroxy-6-hydroxymethyldihydropteridine diphosphokinase [Gemmatimonadaceae bacterium]